MQRRPRRVEEGIAAADRALQIAQQEGTPDDVSYAYTNMTSTYLAASRYNDVARLAVAGLEHARRFGMLAS